MIELTAVVTVYGVKGYLEKCLNSIRRQSFRKFNVLMIVGKGDAECAEICHKYEEQDRRFQMVISDPKGLSDARNVGITLTETEYITFVDGDDYLKEDMFLRLMGLLKKHKCEIVIGNYLIDKGKYGLERPSSVYRGRVYNSDDALKNFFIGHGIQFVVAWGKIYRTGLFKENGIEYPVGRLHEDNLTTYKLLYHASRIGYTNKVVYYYVDRESSLSYNMNLEKEKVIVESIAEIKEYLGNKKELLDYLEAYRISVNVSYILRAAKSNNEQGLESYVQAVKELKKIYFMKNKLTRIRMKVLCSCIVKMPHLMQIFLKKVET